MKRLDQNNIIDNSLKKIKSDNLTPRESRLLKRNEKKKHFVFTRKSGKDPA